MGRVGLQMMRSPSQWPMLARASMSFGRSWIEARSLIVSQEGLARRWDSPAVAACPLAAGAQSGRTARKFTRNTLKDWGLASLADDAEAIVGEFVANAVSHASRSVASGQPLGLRLLRRTGEVMCAVLDPSDIAPVLRMPDRNEEAGRGLQMVDALSDVWGWSPVTGRGKAVWAILFCALSALLALT